MRLDSVRVDIVTMDGEKTNENEEEKEPLSADKVIAECIEKPKRLGWWTKKTRRVSSLLYFGNNNSNQFDPNECTLIPKQNGWWTKKSMRRKPTPKTLLCRHRLIVLSSLLLLFVEHACVSQAEGRNPSESITIYTMNGKDTLAHDEKQRKKKENYTWCMFVQGIPISILFLSISLCTITVMRVLTLHRRHSDVFNLCLLRVKWKGYLMFG